MPVRIKDKTVYKKDINRHEVTVQTYSVGGKEYVYLNMRDNIDSFNTILSRTEFDAITDFLFTQVE